MLGVLKDVLLGNCVSIIRRNKLYLEKIVFFDPENPDFKKEVNEILIDTGSPVTCIPLADASGIFKVPVPDLRRILIMFKYESPAHNALEIDGFHKDIIWTISGQEVICLRRNVAIELRQKGSCLERELNVLTALEIEEPLLGMDFVDEFLLLVPKKPSDAYLID